MISVLSLVKGSGGIRSVRGLLAWHVLALSVCFQWPAFAVLGEETSAVDGSAKTVTRGRKPVGVDARVALLSKELNLDATQQASVRRLLLQQRAQTLKVWNDEAVPAAVRIKATQGVADRTADQIRALLNDAQRTRYSMPHNRDAEQHFASEDLESWMRGSAPKGTPAPQQ